MLTIQNKLDNFSPISLAKLKLATLLDRVDTKYAFEKNKLPEILEEIRKHYFILEVNGQRCSDYSSLYFDTPDFDLFNDHRTGRLSRYKIRFREYVKSGIKYFEIKHKNNKSRTIKYRVLQDKISSLIIDSAKDFLIEKTNYNPQDFSAKLWVNYSRLTFISRENIERVTIDFNISFKSLNSAKSFPNLVIAEVKQAKTGKSFFKFKMKEKRIRPVTLSKYCLGVVNLYENVKKNNFKSKLKLITKIQNGVIANCF